MVKYFLAVISHLVFAFLVLKILNYILTYEIAYHFARGFNAVLFLLFSLLTFRFTKKIFLNAKVQPYGKAVFITGCDSGFGHLLARRLDSKGFSVFAGCLFPSGPGAFELKESCSEELKVIELDVTQDESVKNAAEIVQTNLGHCKLWAIVNNAGIIKGSTAEHSDLKSFYDCMDVNVFGQVRVAKAFLPFLRKSKGRVVNITSIAGRLAFPYFTPYCMSKFASDAFNDCLRQELSQFGVDVISVSPEIFKTQLTSGSNNNFVAALDKVENDINYGRKKMNVVKMYHWMFHGKLLPSSKVHLVIDDIESAVTSVYPNSSYLPSRNPFIGIFIRVWQVTPSIIQHSAFRFATKVLELFYSL